MKKKEYLSGKMRTDMENNLYGEDEDRDGK